MKRQMAECTFGLGGFVMDGRRMGHGCEFEVAVGGHSSPSEIQREADEAAIDPEISTYPDPRLHGIR